MPSLAKQNKIMRHIQEKKKKKRERERCAEQKPNQSVQIDNIDTNQDIQPHHDITITYNTTHCFI
jgi:hypothetical protein